MLYADETPQAIVDNITKENHPAAIVVANVLLLLVLICSVPTNVNPTRTMFIELAVELGCSPQTMNGSAVHVLITTLIMIFCTVIAVAVPSISYLVSILGGFLGV